MFPTNNGRERRPKDAECDLFQDGRRVRNFFFHFFIKSSEIIFSVLSFAHSLFYSGRKIILFTERNSQTNYCIMATKAK